ncbi:MAG: metal-dependent hydrolase [Bacteroidota bacterium]
MELTFYGHACFSVKAGGKDILFDPFISGNEKATAIDIDSIPADFMLITHGHADHMADAIPIAKRTGAKVVSNYEIVVHLGGQGVENGHPMNHGGKWKFDFGTAKYVNAVHSSSFADGSYAGQPGGFILETGDGNFYYSGDTALTYDMKLFGAQHDLDFAVLPIGDNFTMGIDDAVMAAEFVNVKKVVGVHYDTFGYIVIDHEAAKAAFAAKGIELLLPGIGETITV